MAGVQSIERAFALLRAIAVGPSGVTALATAVDLPKSTVARLLQALESEGAIEREPTGSAYRIGTGFADLVATNPRRKLIAAAKPFLIGLTAELGEASGLDMYENGWVQFIDQVDTDKDIMVRDWTGESGRAHALPSGLVVLAHIGADALDTYVSRGLDRLTETTITTRAELDERLAHVRSAGYSWGYEEFAEGINSVAAPLFGIRGILGALRVHGPTFRFPDPERTHDIGRMVAEAAASLSAQLHDRESHD